MSVFFITGKPRGGKSLTAVKDIVSEFMNPASTRFVVTNIRLFMEDRQITEFVPCPLWWKLFGWFLCLVMQKPACGVVERTVPGLVSYIHKHAKHEVDFKSRLRILEDDEAGEFWLYEPGKEYFKRKTIKVNRRSGELDVPDFEDRGQEEKGNMGTKYVIDEVHVYFPSREWQKTGADCTYFLSQHGKLKCDVTLITQHVDQCDKALRRLAQEYMTVRNLSREPVLGFRVGNFFRYIRTLGSPTNPNTAVFESGFIPLDEDLRWLYDTTQGVGIVGGLIPAQERRGRSLWWLAIPVVLFLVLCLNVKSLTQWAVRTASRMTQSGIASVMQTGSKVASNSIPRLPPSTNKRVAGTVTDGGSAALTGVAALTSAPAGRAPEAPSVAVPVNVSHTTNAQILIRSFEYYGRGKGSQWRAVISTGEVLTSRTHYLQSIDAFGVMLSGHYYPFHPSKEFVQILDTQAKELSNMLKKNGLDDSPAKALPLTPAGSDPLQATTIAPLPK